MIFLHLSMSSSVSIYSVIQLAYTMSEKNSTVDCAAVLVCTIISVPVN